LLCCGTSDTMWKGQAGFLSPAPPAPPAPRIKSGSLAWGDTLRATRPRLLLHLLEPAHTRVEVVGEERAHELADEPREVGGFSRRQRALGDGADDSRHGADRIGGRRHWRHLEANGPVAHRRHDAIEAEPQR